jgi:hypothetical protein
VNVEHRVTLKGHPFEIRSERDIQTAARELMLSLHKVSSSVPRVPRNAGDEGKGEESGTYQGIKQG